MSGAAPPPLPAAGSAASRAGHRSPRREPRPACSAPPASPSRPCPPRLPASQAGRDVHRELPVRHARRRREGSGTRSGATVQSEPTRSTARRSRLNPEHRRSGSPRSGSTTTPSSTASPTTPDSVDFAGTPRRGNSSRRSPPSPPRGQISKNRDHEHRPEVQARTATGRPGRSRDDRRRHEALLVRYTTGRHAPRLAATANALLANGVRTPAPRAQLDDGRVGVDEFVDGTELRTWLAGGGSVAEQLGVRCSHSIAPNPRQRRPPGSSPTTWRTPSTGCCAVALGTGSRWLARRVADLLTRNQPSPTPSRPHPWRPPRQERPGQRRPGVVHRPGAGCPRLAGERPGPPASPRDLARHPPARLVTHGLPTPST